MPNVIAIRPPGPVSPRWVSFCRCGCKGRCGASTWPALHERIEGMTHSRDHQLRRGSAS